jgi:hypothetical protein
VPHRGKTSLAAREGEQVAATLSHPSGALLPATADKAEASTSSPSASAANRWAAIRPHCINPDCCAGSGSKHCHTCLKARDAAIIADEAAA